MSRASTLLHGGPVTSEDVSGLQEKLMFDRIPVWDRYISFFVLVALSTIIAAYGVTRDSAATVIGAMIVAPLMTPIMAISLGAITGDTRNIIRSTLVVFSGVALVVGLSYLLATILPGELHQLSHPGDGPLQRHMIIGACLTHVGTSVPFHRYALGT